MEGRRELKRIELDTIVGMAASNLVALAIILTTAATLNANGITDIQHLGRRGRGARAGRRRLCVDRLRLGIVGTGLLAVPVLAGSAAYAVGEALRWPVGLDRKPKRGQGLLRDDRRRDRDRRADELHADRPDQGALIWAAVINGVVAVPVMAVMMLVATAQDDHGRVHRHRPAACSAGWRPR